jgi:replicative superfamily II helicase
VNLLEILHRTVLCSDWGFRRISPGIVFEFDPYFGLSISRVNLLHHQIECVYDYLLKLPGVRFLLAADTSAGKTIVADLLLRELWPRGLVDRTFIICPAIWLAISGGIILTLLSVRRPCPLALTFHFRCY